LGQNLGIVLLERNTTGLSSQVYDVIVIGGGITGVCLARETAGRGLKTLLVEKGDFGEGTSSATTKYIHGGIRYLEQYQFGVVRESLRERRILGLAAPHLVSQTRFLMPAWKWSKPPATLIGAGVGLYTALGFDRNKQAPDSMKIPLPRWIPKKHLLKDVPWLNPNDLHGAWAYHDTLNVHPERLLLAFLMSAIVEGASAINHMRADGFLTENESSGNVRVEGVTLIDELTGDRHQVKARAVVNAAGPWMDLILNSLPKRLGVGVNRSKGVHLLTRPIGSPDAPDAVFARARNGQHVIVSPWQKMSFIGPTDTPMGDVLPDDVAVDSSDVNLILDTVNDTVDPSQPNARLTEEDIKSVSVGIRPLIQEEGGSTYKASRRAELYNHAPAGVTNLWSIGGGKWTTARAMSEHVAKELVGSVSLAGARTRPFDSTGLGAFGAFGWAQDAGPFLTAAARQRPDLSASLSNEVRLHVARLYGTQHERILDLVASDPAMGYRVSERAGCFDIMAQVVFAITDESARTLGDVIHRRLVIGTLGPLTDDELRRVANTCSGLLGWSMDETIEQVQIEQRRRLAIEALRQGRHSHGDQPAARK
jgi:glycerol-3-phosphate dehydrogenase